MAETENSFFFFNKSTRYLEESFGATEALVSDGDDLSVGKFVGLLERGGGGGGGHLLQCKHKHLDISGLIGYLLEVEGDVAELLLDVTDDLTLSSGRE